ncbi:endothelin-converting enzyme homolog [Trichonephila inaurata madagascariensis]|uniref:Endothelin-converting enzyme homolog n=1 Tax=Trichonephila inaurata madagascariensis TaxID=2747483 RepID=A0A8X7BWI6_9ARAC|nr:endothelin-converting enzyme homolog [Trichonephila inaurata madagascariensis]
MEKLLLAITAIMLVTALSVIAISQFRHVQDKEFCSTPACLRAAANILDSMDQSVDPCEDFYQYACGGWMKSNPLPAGKSDWNIFKKLAETNNLILKEVLEDENFVLKSAAEAKARTYYRSCMNQKKINELGTRPMLEVLKKLGVENITSDFNLTEWNFQRMLGIIQDEYNVPSLFQWEVMADVENSSRNSIAIKQIVPTLKSKMYYVNKTKDDKILSTYLNYMTKVGVLLGGEEKTIRSQMEDVLDFETKLAEIIVPKGEKKAGSKLYEKIGQNISSSQEITILSTEYLQKLSKLITKYQSNPSGQKTIRNYLVWILVHRNIRYLPKPFVDATDKLQQILTGSKIENDWKICILSVDKAVGFALGAMFVRKAFPGESKPMVNSIKEMIGFPEYITDFDKLDEKYQELEFNETQYFENHLKFVRFDRLNNFKKLRQPSNQDNWLMTPSTVNAYYSAPSNTIVFPAAILQPPLYDLTYPKFVNFGSVGVVMGHELTHAFDVQGRLYDKYGNLHQWWKNSSILNFRLRAKCFLDQYSTYEMNGVKVNGKLTLGENIADSGGLKAAFRAYRNWVKKNHAELPLPGIPLSTNQLFFVAFAQTWCSVKTPELQRFASLTDPHSPNKYRVIGTLSNSIDFNWEFKCPSESAMNAEIKCEAWR